MISNSDIAKLRRDYKLKSLDESSVSQNPFEQFSLWLEDAIKTRILDPNAMILATSNKKNVPSVRTVLLKEIETDGLVFFTNYKSHKAKDLIENKIASSVFLWKELERQIRITGIVKKISKEQSENYFRTRPYESKIGAWASMQSSEIPNRKFLEDKFEYYKNKFLNTEVPLPPFWGGYKLFPIYFEFWQGRQNRLHDRIIYEKNKKLWKIKRLAP
jgi:pyridoxamine 5'-phosphate oxidase